MAFTKPNVNKSIWRAKPDVVRGKSAEVKADFDRLINENSADLAGLIGELEAPGAAASIGSASGTVQAALDARVRFGNDSAKYLRVNSDKVLETSADGTAWEATGSSGHVILDKDGAQLAQRARLQFASSTVTDDAESGVTIVNGVKGDKGDTGPSGPQGPTGAQGPVGPVMTPSISNEGVISWTVQQSAVPPANRNIRGPQGVQGIQGPQGEQGIQGIAGSPGAQGPQGPQGAAGAAGADGRSFTVHGRYNTLLALQNDHPTGEDGDAWAVGSIADNHVYVWDLTDQNWKDVGPIVGPMGPQGPQGVQGPKGDTGEQGPRGLQGVQGVQGVQGEQGVGARADTWVPDIGQVSPRCVYRQNSNADELLDFWALGSGTNYPSTGNFWYVNTVFYAGVSLTNNRRQQAYSYTGNGYVYERIYNGGVWTDWNRVYTAANKPTAADVGALPTSGGTVTGNLAVNGNATMKNSTDYTASRARNIQFSTTDLTAGTSTLANGALYFVYE